MALDAVNNFAKVTVSTGYTSSSTSIVLSSGNGAKLPATTPYNLIWWNSTTYPDPADDPNVEIVTVTGIATDTLTVTRGAEGTTASAKNTAGAVYKMMQGPTAKTITDLLALTQRPYNCGRLVYSTTAIIKFVPFNGDAIRINGTIYQIPAAGVSAGNTGSYVNGVAGQTLTNGVVYLVSITAAGLLKFWQTGTWTHGPDTTAGNIGTEVIWVSGAPQSTDTLVGMVYYTSNIFQDGPSARFIASWFNRHLKSVLLQGANLSGTSSTIGLYSYGVQTSFGNSILVWADDAIAAFWNGQTFVSGGDGTNDCMFNIYWDSGNTICNQFAFSLNGGLSTACVGGWSGITEGLHSINGSIGWNANVNTATVAMNNWTISGSVVN